MAATEVHEGHAPVLEHRGPQIEKAYYPEYADQAERIYPLNSWQVNWGSAILLLGMATLGLPLAAFAYHQENGSVSMGMCIAALVFCVVVNIVGLAIIVAGFKTHKRDEAH
ncbi:hypothetical protein [Dietzia sp.]|uniref:hypothetical protein n=1 Tax=Dietzia sp. TaxID=1871616 RepID=UPI002FDA435D